MPPLLMIAAAAAATAAVQTSAFVAPSSRTCASSWSAERRSIGGNSRECSPHNFFGSSATELMSGQTPLSEEREEAVAAAAGEDEDDDDGFMDDTELIETLESFNPINLKVDEHWVTPKYEMEHDVEEEAPLSIWAARGLLLAVAVLWGTNFASVKYLETLCFHPPCNHPPSEAAFARFGVAALVGLPLLVGQRKDIILAGLECGLWITLGYITQAMALSTISSGKCAFICSLTVVVVPLISAIFFNKPIKPVNLASAALAIAGVGVLEGMLDLPALLGIQPAVADATAATAALASAAADAGTAVASSSSAIATASTAAASTDWIASAAATVGIGKGDLLALGQPFGFGISFLRIEHYVEKFEDVDNRILTMAAAQCLTVGVISLLWVLYDFHGTIPDMSYMIEPHRIGAIAWTGIMTTVVAIYFEGVALQVASATEAALTFASEPVWATLFGAWLLREELNLNSYVGGAVILAACLLSAVADLPSGEEGGKEEVNLMSAVADLPTVDDEDEGTPDKLAP